MAGRKAGKAEAEQFHTGPIKAKLATLCTAAAAGLQIEIAALVIKISAHPVASSPDSRRW